MKKKALLLLGLCLSHPTLVDGVPVTISRWTFEASVPTTAGPHLAEEGLSPGSASGYRANSTTWSNLAGNGSAESFSASNWAIGDYWQFQVSTLGYEDIVLTWHQTRSSGGPTTWDFSYSVNGIDFTVASNDYAVSSVTWSSGGSPQPPLFSVDLSAVPLLSDKSTVFLRITAASAPASTSGTSRIDNFTVTGTVIQRVPETLPAGFAAGTLFLLLASARLSASRQQSHSGAQIVTVQVR